VAKYREDLRFRRRTSGASRTKDKRTREEITMIVNYTGGNGEFSAADKTRLEAKLAKLVR